MTAADPISTCCDRLAHWLMKEPDLEEEALRASAKGREIMVERQSVSGEARETNLIAPDGSKTKLDMTPYAPGLSRAHLTVDRFGLYRAEDGEHVALVNVGQEIRSKCGTLSRTPRSCARSLKRPAARRVALLTRALRSSYQEFVGLNPSSNYGGANYIGVKRTGSTELIGARSTSLASGFFGLAALFGITTLAWVSEGGGLRRGRGEGQRNEGS